MHFPSVPMYVPVRFPSVSPCRAPGLCVEDFPMRPMAEPVLRAAHQEPPETTCGSRGNVRIHIGGEDGMLGCTGVYLQSPASRSQLRPPQNLTKLAAVSPREPPAVYAVADDVSDGCTGVNLQSCRRLVVADGTTASAPPAHASPRGLNTRGPATFGRLPRLMSQGDGTPRCTGGR